jgi:acyl-CoA synthetase (AMP-forming)/AMP-acid ligase II
MALVDSPLARPQVLNVGRRLSHWAARMPDADAVIVQGRRSSDGRHEYQHFSFRRLEEDSERIARGLVRLGAPRGARVALLVRPGYEFIVLVFGLFKAGVVQVLIDPGLGRRQAIRCLAEVEPEGFVAVSLGQAVRVLLRRHFPRAAWNVTVGRRWFWGGTTLAELLRTGDKPARLPETAADDPAAIIFTSGSTGPPKGVLYRHGNFDRQVDEIRQRYGLQPGGIDLACFPLFALFNAGLGVTTVIPHMDAARPARADPRTLASAIHDLEITQSFASPAVWDRLGRHCEAEGVRLPTLRRVMSAGAPVPAHVLRRMRAAIAADGEVHTPYGATEALPVASIEAAEVLGETASRTATGAGVCVGTRFPGIEWRVIRITDVPIANLSDSEVLPDGQIGELIVRGPVVTREYVVRSDANSLAKIADGQSVWHRLGDVGYLDERERFWFCGRKSQRVTTAAGTFFTIPCEAVFNEHPDVRRTALVGLGPRGAQRPAIVVEPAAGRWPRTGRERQSLLAALRTLGQAHRHTAAIEHFLVHRSLPVDVRHNAKIFREKLAVWAARRLPAEAKEP